MTKLNEVDLNELEEIKNKIDIVEYIGKYVTLKQAGRNFKGCCPFHNEKTPSFMVSPEKQIFHCFGCGKGGDVFTFTEEIEGVDFPTALREMAEKAGVKLPERSGARREPTDKLFEINNQACELYEKELWSERNKKVLKYLLDRGMSEKTIKAFRLGFAPSSGDIVIKELGSIGYTNEELLKAGIVKESARGGQDSRLRDQFFNRITFPIMNAGGRVVGFTARVLDDSLPKYVNTPETAIYHKSSVLFGFDKAKEQIRKQNHVIIVEGQMDAIFSYQAGVKNVVASSGTALTEAHLDLIKRFTKNIKMSFDVDMAGQSATRRAIELAWERDFNIKVIAVPEGKDPADLVKADPKKWVDACRKAKYVVDYIFDSTFSKYNITNIVDKKQATRELLATINKLPDPVERDHYLNLLATKIGVSSAALEAALAKVKSVVTGGTKSTGQTEAGAKTQALTREEYTLSVLLLSPKYIEFFFNKLDLDDFLEIGAHNLVEKIQKYTKKNKEFSISKWLITLESEEANYASKLQLMAENTFVDASEETISEEIFNAVMRLKRENIEREKKILGEKMAIAERGNDNKLMRQLMTQLQQIIEKERNI
jgi:DNA primase